MTRKSAETRIRIIESRDRRSIARLLSRGAREDRVFEGRVRTIVDRVRTSGDRALIGFAKRFDGVQPPLEVSPDEMRTAAAKLDPSVRRAIARAAANVARVAFRQIPRHWDLDVVPGVSVEQRVEPLARVGCYVPGGRFPLPSSLLMTAVPARVAGVAEVIVMCPRPDASVMAAALEAGVTRLFRVGGAHAIAALAYGTATVPRVDKIVGPGNRYVAAAKALVAGTCAIDFYAGPTEIVIVSGRGRPEWIAADLVAQAEHDPDARSIFITCNRLLAAKVARAVAARQAGRAIVARSLASNGAIVITRSEADAIDLANRIAPEHLVVDRESLIRRPIVAGAVFVGPYSAQAAGDYATGSNHVLPTAGAARWRGGLSAADFMRVMSVQRLTRDGLARLAPTILPLARAEGLTAHAASIEVRLKRHRP
ncbi:MAG TPA: histidinol dehydrogenase [Vicinamibacterales bacterium]|nr:histidinol dehydrogenase [Vicinamibacterales bacterium]